MITLETKKAICEEYKDSSKNVDDIAKRYNVTRGVVAHIAVEMGAEPRRSKAYGQAHPRKKARATVRTCPKCRKTIDIKGASFCCFCGTDIRSNKELLIERINNAMRKTVLMPEGIRDEMQRLFVDIKTELSKEG